MGCTLATSTSQIAPQIGATEAHHHYYETHDIIFLAKQNTG
jgi:hypothetical protein